MFELSLFFISKLGDDMFGRNFLKTIQEDNINIDNVTFTDKAPTSVASILVDNDGKNAIAVNFGATFELREEDVQNAEEAIRKSKLLVTTMMVKNATLAALKLAKKKHIGPFRKDEEARFENRQKDMGTLVRAGFSYDVVQRVVGYEE